MIITDDLNSEVTVSMNDIKKLQNNILIMVRQLMDFKPTHKEATEILEHLMRMVSSSEERINKDGLKLG